MLRLAGRRILMSLPLFVFVSFLVFLLVHLAPGDAASYVAGDTASAEQIAAVRERLGLNEPFLVQYGQWLGGLFTGDLGTSLFSSVPVSDAIIRRLPVTLWLALGSIIVALVIAVPSGIIAALRAGGLLDRTLIVSASVGIATPNFFLGLILILVFSHWAGWFPATQYVSMDDGIVRWMQHLALPAVALGVALAAELARHLRASMRDVLRQDYVRTAYAKGLPTWKVVGKHGLKHAAAPVVTVLGLQTRMVIGSAVVIETVFALPGIGSLAVNAVLARDLPLIQGITMAMVLLVLIVNLLVDLSYGYLDPRVRVT